MDAFELQQRISQWENLHTEFKETIVHPDKLAASLAAFANTDGGQLIIGVQNDGVVVGVADMDKAMRAVDNAAYQNCEPPLTVLQETVVVDDAKTVLVVNVPKGDQRPYRTNKGVYYIRTTSSRRQASRQELLRLFQATKAIYYDETPESRATLSDLNTQAIISFFERTYSGLEEMNFERILVNVKLAAMIEQTTHPTFAGILFFANQPQWFIPYAYISALRIPSNTLAQAPSDQKKIEGTVTTVLEDALRFLYIHLPVPHHIRKLEPEAKPEFPEVVLRELLVNAIAHRDYTIQGPIRMIIFDNRVEIRSPGLLPNTITLEALRFGAHMLRNPTIYNLLLRMGLATDAGSGIPRAIARLQKMSGKSLALRLEGNEFVVSLPRTEDES